MRVIAITGMPGSGKEEFVKIAQKEGFFVVRMGDVVRDEVKRRDLELSDVNIGNIANSEREKCGMGIWAEKTVPLVKGTLVFIDGIRGDAELEVFRKAFGGNMKVVCIQCSSKIRYERIKKRRRKDATMTWEAFCERDERELGWGIDKALALCDYVIENEGTLEEFQDEVRGLLLSLK
ncbi:MAG: flagellar hook-basal body complex protein FliE [Thermoplasmata archaeon]|nr:MAG: flagellar hook-basal body complex protein FliE [Thermoplasmata archaeon]